MTPKDAPACHRDAVRAALTPSGPIGPVIEDLPSADPMCMCAVAYGRPSRVDSCRNAFSILDAASRIFASRGPDVALDDVAAAAGVGIATLYRRFPDRDALFRAILAERINRLEAMLDYVEALDDPVLAFDELYRIATNDGRESVLAMGFVVASRNTPISDEQSRRLTPIQERAEVILSAAQDKGAVAPGVSMIEISYLLSTIFRGLDGLDREQATAFVSWHAALLRRGLAVGPIPPLGFVIPAIGNG